MPRHLASGQNQLMTGAYDFEDHGPDAGESRLILPNASTAPAVTLATAGQLMYIPTSGKLIMSSGDSWLSAERGAMFPTDDAISGDLMFWGHEGGIQLESLGASGVSGWVDFGPRGFDFSQTNTSLQPSVQSGVIGGKDALYFDGTEHLNNDGAITGFFNGGDLWDITVIAVLEMTFDDGTEAMSPGFTASRSSSTQAILEGPMHVHWGLGPSGIFRNFIRESSGGDNSDIRVYEPEIPQENVVVCLSNTIKSSPDDEMELFYNGASFGTPSGVNTNIGSIACNQTTIGAYRRSGGTLSFHVGRLYEIAVFDEALASGDRARIESYMMKKWGLA